MGGWHFATPVVAPLAATFARVQKFYARIFERLADDGKALKKFFNTICIYILTTLCIRATGFASSLMRGVSGDDPEGAAGSGVLRRRLVTARLGRLGTPPSRHYDLGARSSLDPIRRPPKRGCR